MAGGEDQPREDAAIGMTGTKFRTLEGMRTILITIVCLALFGSAAARQTIIFTNATIIDGTGREPQPHTALIIKDGRIVNVTRGKIVPPPEAIQVDMTGKYLMPSIIDCHSHVGNLQGTTTSGDNYTSANVRRQLLRFQNFGVAAILSMGTEQPLGIGLRDSPNAGWIHGATMYSAIYGFGVKGAMPPEAMGMTHLYHLSDAHSLVAAGIDIMAHSIRDAEIDDSLVAEMKAKHVSYIPTLALDEFAFAYLDDPDWLRDPRFKASLEPGVYEMITSAAYKEKIGKSPVTPQEETALTIALKNLIRLYRAGIPIGTLEPGKKADFLVLDADPIKDIRNTLSISQVWKDGAKVSDGPLTP
jgi:hypothetical protein